jgi:tetratricopeptide (TPR) repeat protein
MRTPYDVYALTITGQILSFQDNFPQAIEYFDKELKINPNDVDALSYKGGLLLVLDKYEEAWQYFEKALAISPNNLIILHGMAYALTLYSNDYSKALKLVTKY